MRIPQDIAGLLVVAIRDALWFKRRVKAFLTDCRVPQPYLGQATKRLDSEPTITVVRDLLEQLDQMGDAGELPQRSMLTHMIRWKDFSSLKADQQQGAKDAVKALADAYSAFESQRQYEQEQTEKKMHAERESRAALKPLDHDKLKSFRDEFDKIWVMSDEKERGNSFEKFLNVVFDYYSESSRGAFNRVGEQLDGLFYFDKHYWYVEIRWKKEKGKAADISVLRDRAKDAFGGDTKALFISFNGFSDDCFQSLTNKSDERVILMDGMDLRDVLDCAIAFDVLLAEKTADIVRNKRPYVCAREIISRRNQGS